MSGYPQGKQIQELAKRTLSNLAIIDRLAEIEKNMPEDEKTAFEVTQLINSFMGLIVAPQEQLYNEYPPEFSDKKVQKVFEWCKENGDYSCSYCIKGCPREGKEAETLKEFIRHIRNCVSHMSFPKSKSNIDSFFQPVGGTEITDLYFISKRAYACNLCKERKSCEQVQLAKSRQVFKVRIPIVAEIEGQSVQIMKTLVTGFSKEISSIAGTLK